MVLAGWLQLRSNLASTEPGPAAIRIPLLVFCPVLCTHVQIMRKLAELCIQAQQQHAPIRTQEFAAFVLFTWLSQAKHVAASPDSSLLVLVQQQLQETGLLQHLAASLADAANELSDVGNTAACSKDGRSYGSGSASSTAEFEQDRARIAPRYADVLLESFAITCFLLSPADGDQFNLDVPLPAVPAALRLALTMFRACSRLPQQLQQQAVRLGATNHVLYASNSFMMEVGGRHSAAAAWRTGAAAVA